MYKCVILLGDSFLIYSFLYKIKCFFFKYTNANEIMNIGVDSILPQKKNTTSHQAPNAYVKEIKYDDICWVLGSNFANK